MSARHDVAVLGAGIEGLTAAAHLARAGRSVVVLERRAQPGGSAAREEFHPGFHANGVLPDAALVRRELLEPLGLERHGLRWRAGEPALLVPHQSGCPLLLRRNPTGQERELPPEEAAKLRELRERLARFAPLFSAVIDERPPDAASPSWQELMGLGLKALGLRRLGKTEMFTLARLLPSSAWDWMEEACSMEAVRVGLVAPALAGTVLGPRAPGTSTLVFLRQALAGPEPVGGPSALVDALLSACRELKVTLRCSAEVRAIRLATSAAPTASNGAARGVAGVELAGGEVLECGRVASSLGAVATLIGLLPPATLLPSLERSVQTFRTRGATAVLRLALEKAPIFAGLDGREQEPVEHAVSAESLLDLERASDALKYRSLPRRPWVEVWIPSHAAEGLAPAGRAVAIVACHTVPHDLSGEGGWTSATRSRLETAMLAEAEKLAPGITRSVLGKELLTPVDIEERFGTAGGHVFDGELALDQLWLQRPSLALSRYATPVPGLFLCGSCAHPGGPFRAGAGTLGARALLAAR